MKNEKIEKRTERENQNQVNQGLHPRSSRWRHAHVRCGAGRYTVRLGMTRGGLLFDAGLRSSLVKQKRSEEHTSEIQSRLHLVCLLPFEKQNMYIHRLLISHS